MLDLCDQYFFSLIDKLFINQYSKDFIYTKFFYFYFTVFGELVYLGE